MQHNHVAEQSFEVRDGITQGARGIEQRLRRQSPGCTQFQLAGCIIEQIKRSRMALHGVDAASEHGFES